jgi:flagellar hook-basal body complex protein FliE
MIEAISVVGAFQPGAVAEPSAAGKGASSFVDWFDKELMQANQMINDANVQVQRFAAGENVPTHHLMLALEEAKLAFQIMAQVRSRLLEGYQEVMRMQI